MLFIEIMFMLRYSYLFCFFFVCLLQTVLFPLIEKQIIVAPSLGFSAAGLKVHRVGIKMRRFHDR